VRGQHLGSLASATQLSCGAKALRNGEGEMDAHRETISLGDQLQHAQLELCFVGVGAAE
jgi:hypothetical protein